MIVPAGMYPGIALLAAATAFGLPSEHISTTDLKYPVVKVRQVAMWLLHDCCRWGQHQIGRIMGKDHVTVGHAWKQVQAAIDTDPLYKEQLVKARALFIKGIGMDRDSLQSLTEHRFSQAVERRVPA